jgi:hypothetical protein
MSSLMDVTFAFASPGRWCRAEDVNGYSTPANTRRVPFTFLWSMAGIE